MIKRIRVQNFKSLRDVDLELGTRNVLVGPNMSGKSNIMDVLRFLSWMVSPPSAGVYGLTHALTQLGGFWEVTWKGGDSNLVSIGVEGVIPAHVRPTQPGPLQFDYGVSVVGDRQGYFTVQEEHLFLSDQRGRWDAIRKDREAGRRTLTRPDGSVAMQVPDASRSAMEFGVPDWEGSVVGLLFASPRFYKLVPAVIKATVSPTAAATSLLEHGQNLASWLMIMQTKHGECFGRVASAMRDAFPDIEGLFTEPTPQSTVFVSSRERSLRRPTSVLQMSDGELAFLSLLSLIYAPPELSAPVFCVEEPENHLHPRLLEMLAGLLKQRQSELPPDQRATILISTHSPLLLDHFDLDEIVVVEKREGATVCMRPREKEHLKELLQRRELGLGDLFYSGALGGG